MFRFIVAATCLAGVLAASPSLHAAGAGGNAFPKPKPQPVCKKKNYIYSEKKKKCVKKKAGLIPDQHLIEQGWQLAYADRADEAIGVFNLVADKTRPRLLNGLGYAHRKLGRMNQAVAYYRTAIAIAPDYVLAREYLGEGYVKMGRIDLAREQLKEIRVRCGMPCQPYRELAAVIRLAQATRPD